LKQGESVGILGDNGAGKSTLLKLIAGIYKPTVGRIHVAGRIGAIVELGSAFAPNLSGRENIRPQALLQGYSHELMCRQLDRIIEFADLGDFIDSPVVHYSTGMRARLGFAVAALSEPDLLVVDEVLAVGDLAFQNKCLRFVEGFRARGGAVVFVGHNPVQMQAACERGIILERGRVAFDGSIVDAIDRLFNSAEAQSNKVSPALFATDLLSKAALPANGPTSRGIVEVLATRVCYHQPGGTATKGSVVLDLTLGVHEIVPRLQVGISFFSNTSAQAIAFSVSDSISLPLGVHQVTMHIPSLPLLPGDYLVKLAVIGGLAPYPLWTQGWHNAPRSLRIPGRPTMLTSLARMVSAKIQLDSQVSVKVADAAGEVRSRARGRIC
jgi:lipopolysaccharide transport system ATP-binding protein